MPQQSISRHKLRRVRTGPSLPLLLKLDQLFYIHIGIWHMSLFEVYFLWLYKIEKYLDYVISNFSSNLRICIPRQIGYSGLFPKVSRFRMPAHSTAIHPFPSSLLCLASHSLSFFPLPPPGFPSDCKFYHYFLISHSPGICLPFPNRPQVCREGSSWKNKLPVQAHPVSNLLLL